MSMDDVPPATDTAREIHERFLRKMAPGGPLDQILNGGPGEPKRPPLSDPEIALIQRQVETQLAEYATAISSAVEWHGEWKSRRPKGFRAKRRRAKPAQEAAE